MKYTILHNSRCSKSRAGIQILTDSGVDFNQRFYLEQPLSIDELYILKDKLGIEAIGFTRTGESDFKVAGLTKQSSEDEIFEAMQKYPKLLERPIVFDDTKAVIGRPPENIKDFLGL